MDITRFKTKEQLQKAIRDRESQLYHDSHGELTMREAKKIAQLEHNLYRLRHKLEQFGKDKEEQQDLTLGDEI